MLKLPAVVTLLLASLAGSGCAGDPVARVADVAERMNASGTAYLEKATAEGSTLVVRYKPLGAQRFSDAQITKMIGASICKIDGMDSMLSSGATLRMEIPRGGPYLQIAVERCDGDEAVVRSMI